MLAVETYCEENILLAEGERGEEKRVPPCSALLHAKALLREFLFSWKAYHFSPLVCALKILIRSPVNAMMH